MPPILRRAGPMLLIGAGGTLMISAVMNLLSALVLLEPSDADSLGISKVEVLWWYGAVLVAAALMIGWGIWLRRQRK